MRQSSFSIEIFYAQGFFQFIDPRKIHLVIGGGYNCCTIMHWQQNRDTKINDVDVDVIVDVSHQPSYNLQN